MMDTLVHTKHSQEDVIGETGDHLNRDTKSCATLSPERTFFGIATSGRLEQSEFSGMLLKKTDLGRTAAKHSNSKNDNLRRSNAFGSKECTLSSATKLIKDIIQRESKDPSEAKKRKPAGHQADERDAAAAVALRKTFKGPGNPSNFENLDRTWAGFVVGSGLLIRDRDNDDVFYTLGYKFTAGYIWRTQQVAEPWIYYKPLSVRYLSLPTYRSRPILE
jgi:hypothetical protein